MTIIKTSHIKLPKIEQIKLGSRMTVNQLIVELGKAGVMGAGRISKAADIFEEMIKEKREAEKHNGNDKNQNSESGCKIFLGVAGAMVPGGMKNIIIDMLKNDYADVLVVTGATLTHDMVEALGFSHYQGSSDADDKELFKQGIDRMYDSYMPSAVYSHLEDFFRANIEEIKKARNIKEFLNVLGKLVPRKNGESILSVCHDKKIPLFCPGIADSGIGLMMYNLLASGRYSNKSNKEEDKISVDVFDDLREIMDIAWETKKAGVIYVGGGLPKNYIQQAMQLSPNPAVYGIQITMDRPEHGGSSGASLVEGISWGKMKAEGKFVDVICDATIALPLILAAVKERIEK